MSSEEPEINLKRFKRHERKIPWALIRKIIIAAILIGLTLYFTNSLKGKNKNSDEIEINFE